MHRHPVMTAALVGTMVAIALALMLVLTREVVLPP